MRFGFLMYAMQYPTPPTVIQTIREESLTALARILHALGRRFIRVGQSLGDASDRVACYEFATREKTIR